MPLKSYIEPHDLPTNGFSDLPTMLDSIKYADIRHEDKPEVVVVKETFVLRNRDATKVGVVTRSQKDHRDIVGDCSILLNGDFIKDECKSYDGRIYYDVNDRLHEHLGTLSSAFRPVETDGAMLIHYRHPPTNKKYIFVIFEMMATDHPLPFHLRLKTRVNDAFVGCHDIGDVSAGLKKFNQQSFDIDKQVLSAIKRPSMIRSTKASFFNLEVKPAAVSASITVFKVNIFGVG